jgi:hypothetical protein
MDIEWVTSEQTCYWWIPENGLERRIVGIVLQMPPSLSGLVHIAGRGSKGAISTNRFVLAHNTVTHKTYGANVVQFQGL